MHNDPVANRDSYAGFRGGYDNGMSEERADEVPDLIRYVFSFSTAQAKTACL